jgi:hypothetical protein
MPSAGTTPPAAGAAGAGAGGEADEEKGFKREKERYDVIFKLYIIS